MEKLVPIMQPPPGTRLQRFMGDRIRFTVTDYEGKPIPKGWQARLRTNLGRAEVLCKEIIQAHTKKLSLAAASWHDLPMSLEGMGWSLELPLTEIGYFKAKAYFVDPKGWQHWPEGADVGISVHPDRYRTGNTIYCAFTRMFGETKTEVCTENAKLEDQLQQLDEKGYSVIPPSGKFRDLIQQLPHIIDTLGCRVLHLLPVNPVPTTYARYGRFGSPYAALDLTAIDPALVEFDQRTTAVDQFRELAYATHLRGARLFLDIVINHTGWGSRLQDEHPEWFLRDPSGKFISPGAWGTVWEDLVELEHRHVELWDYVAEALLVWCRRGVDGFRCDAGYKVPLPAWQYIIARVRQEYPETLFLLEGLGGSWEVTQQLLTEGGMQWAYSELFQNYSPGEVAGYLDYSIQQSERSGLMVHYSETHDNDRLAKRGRTWSLMRNELCALASVSGGFGFTCGVEWLATEKINVHSSRGMAWDHPINLISELARLNSLLLEHPCFFDGAKLTRLSSTESPVYALQRDSQEGKDSVLVLVNTDPNRVQSTVLPGTVLRELGDLKFELTTRVLPQVKFLADGAMEFILEPGACHCLSPYAKPQGLSGDGYRRVRAQAAWGFAALGRVLPIEQIPTIPWMDLARIVDQSPAAFLAAISASGIKRVRKSLDALLLPGEKKYELFSPVITWQLVDRRRVLPVPPHHWLLVEDTVPFRASLHGPDLARAQNQESIPAHGGHIACFAPAETSGDAVLILERYAPDDREVNAAIRFLSPEPILDSAGTKPLSFSNLPALREVAATSREVKSEAKAAHPLEQPLALLTNGIGGMARMCVDLGAVKSKYDCLLGANLHGRVPVDRHVFAKRVRVWVIADGFITPLNLVSLASFEPGPPAVWYFVAHAGDGRNVEIQLTANMIAGCNTTVLHFDRPALNLSRGNHLPEHCDVRLTVRVDIEDRNFHSETKRNSGANYHFSANTRPLTERIGFSFTPAVDRQLRVYSDSGIYHHQPEWSENIPHPVEQSRGQTGSGDAYSPGWFDIPMNKGTSVAMVISADTLDPDLAEVQNAKLPESQRTPKGSATRSVFPKEDAFGRQLVRAARSFVVRRDDSFTVIAGYPWFLDWGRDSLICARGLLAAGMVEEVKQLLITFGRFAREGTLPNTIHGEDASNRDTSDAPLWYGIVCEEVAEVLGEGLYHVPVDREENTIGDVLNDIAMSYMEGTPNGIRMDPYSALIWSPSHFTWMDTNHPAGTPREGYPVEIQVLWIRLLYQLRRNSGQPERRRWRELAEQAQASLQKYFWMEDRGYFADLLVAKKGQAAADAGVDNALRSNYLLAISLGLVTGDAARRCVDAALRHLVIPGALRTLAPMPVSPPLPIYGNNGQLLNNPPEPYWGHYEGDEDTRRKPAYHNGTAWTWTFPIFCEALARAWGNSPEAIAAAKAYLGSMDRLLMNGCVGQLPEILDGDAPHLQRGCDAQAWGATEALRVWKFLHNPKEPVIL